MTDPYKILRVKRNATLEEIQARYRKLVHSHHPDKNPGNASAEARFKEIQAAWDLLSDPERRARFDATGDASERRDEDREAHEVLANLALNALQAYVGRLSMGQIDLVAEMHGSLENARNNLQNNIANVKRAKKDLEDAAQRFVRIDGESENILAGVARSEAEKAGQQLAQLELALAFNGRAILLLKKYGYKIDNGFGFGRGATVNIPTSMGLAF